MLKTLDSTSGDQRFSVAHSTAVLDPSCSVGTHVVIEANAVIGASARIDSGVHIGERTRICEGARIGANATLGSDLVVGEKAEIRAGSVVTKSVPPNAVIEGNPAVIVGYVDAPMRPSGGMAATEKPGPAIESTGVRGVTIHTLPVIPDLRGNLTVGDFERQIPFAPKRYFMVFGVPNREVRGEHAHIACHQFLLCVRGSCSVVADDGTRRVEATLDAPNRGMHLPPMTWGVQYKYSPDALLLVFASHYYDPADYIRDYSDFLQRVRGAQ